MRLRSCLFLLAVLAFGCGSEATVVPVSGRITVDNQPLAGAKVYFQPLTEGDNAQPGKGSYGQTDLDGRFTLKIVGENREGAVVANHRVEVHLPETGSDADPRLKPGPPRVQLPRKFNRDSTLRFPVPREGTKEANFDLVTK
jgi:hypothetical protein